MLAATGGGAGAAGGCTGGAGRVAAGGAAGLSTTAGRSGTLGATGFVAIGGAAGGAGLGGAGGGGAAGRGAAAGSADCLLIALSTSPGLEIFERSIFVLISSAGTRGRVRSAAVAPLSPWPLKWRRTFSATSGSIELEWLFFSVTPIVGRKSRTDLLLTSSSLARSLMRTFSITPVSNLYLIPYEPGSTGFSCSGFSSGSTVSSCGASLSAWVCTSATSAGGAFSTPAISPASRACPVSTASV